MSAWDEYFAALTSAHRRAGLPSYRRIRDRTAPRISHDTAGRVIRGAYLPPPGVLEAILCAINTPADDRNVIHERWGAAFDEKLRREQSGSPRAREDRILDELQAIRVLLEKLVEGR